jgi:hypothetical protein
MSQQLRSLAMAAEQDKELGALLESLDAAMNAERC